jgi:hypothetical protein
MVTAIEVLDSAVKIGLGGVISGFATYWVTKTSLDKTAEKERAQRRRDLLESVAQQVAAFNQIALKHWAAVINWTAFTPASEQMAESTRIELVKLHREVDQAYDNLVSAGAKLSLIGELKCYQLLREYGNHVIIYREDVVARRTHGVDELQNYKDEFGKKREFFFTELSNAYKRIEV